MAAKLITTRRDFPSIEELLQSRSLKKLVDALPHPIAGDLIRQVVARKKEKLQKDSRPIPQARLLSEIKAVLTAAKRTEITPVINATGVIVHTNLGRAPLPEALLDAVKPMVTRYSNLEFALDTGSRGKRGAACEQYLARLAGAESATVVNNCAAAVFLVLNTLANRRQVLVSRGELVQIGGGFRIPDILRKSGAKLCELGTTNITTLSDYENNLNERTALILKVHKSNFVQSGFTSEVPLKELAALGDKHGIPVVNDLGSGVLVSTRKMLGFSEPTVRQSVRDGAALTCFSGDKMLGGVQAGLIVGRADLIEKLKKNPLYRTLRVDKFVFAMLEKLFTIYLNGQHESQIKLWTILSAAESELYRRGKQLLQQLGNPAGLTLEATKAYVGGGALPEAAVPSVGIVFSDEYRAATLMRRFLQSEPPVVGRIEDNRFILDLKAVSPEELEPLRQTIARIIKRKP
jgi:L-seryl-tRNA(Ser) seleniumtransferase